MWSSCSSRRTLARFAATVPEPNRSWGGVFRPHPPITGDQSQLSTKMLFKMPACPQLSPIRQQMLFTVRPQISSTNANPHSSNVTWRYIKEDSTHTTHTDCNGCETQETEVPKIGSTVCSTGTFLSHSEAFDSPFLHEFPNTRFLGGFALLAASNTTAVWPCPIGFTTGTERLSWVAQFPYLAEYSYVDECFREQGPGPLWMGMFITPIETVAECGMLCHCPSSGNCLGERAQHSQNYGARRMTTTLSAADNA
ncbi:hypothetical protein B0H14DRAFT_3126172 [Mycena olivaceomarginata]|nr:hypothetical protein B0H14DRAFT_3126172 [Mycena olivaceomarginata]